MFHWIGLVDYGLVHHEWRMHWLFPFCAHVNQTGSTQTESTAAHSSVLRGSSENDE